MNPKKEERWGHEKQKANGNRTLTYCNRGGIGGTLDIWDKTKKQIETKQQHKLTCLSKLKWKLFFFNRYFFFNVAAEGILSHTSFERMNEWQEMKI